MWTLFLFCFLYKKKNVQNDKEEAEIQTAIFHLFFVWPKMWDMCGEVVSAKSTNLRRTLLQSIKCQNPGVDNNTWTMNCSYEQ